MKLMVENKNGFTFVEVLVSVVLLGLIAIGTSQYFISTRLQIQKGARIQAGQQLMAAQIERALSLNYFQLADSLPEVSILVDLNGTPGYRSTTVTGVDDTIDGVAPLDLETPDYYILKVTIEAFNPGNVTDSITYYLTEDRYNVSQL